MESRPTKKILRTKVILHLEKTPESNKKYRLQTIGSCIDHKGYKVEDFNRVVLQVPEIPAPISNMEVRTKQKAASEQKTN